jgi:hypothetical protein
LSYNIFRRISVNNAILKKYFIPILITTTSLLNLSPVRLSLWQLHETDLLPAAWQDAKPVEFPLDQAAEYTLADGSVTLRSPLGVWKSPDAWQVQQAVWTDLNHDSKSEVTLLVRRPFEAWPIDRLLPHAGRIQNHQDVNGKSSHIIMIGWKKDHWGEVWAGSALARPVVQFQVADLNSDGQQELVVLEASYASRNSAQAENLAVWQWNGFGFELVSRQAMPASQFVILKSTQNKGIILVN